MAAGRDCVRAEELKLNFEPKQRAHSRPKVPPAARPPIFMADMAGGLAAGSFKYDQLIY